MAGDIRGRSLTATYAGGPRSGGVGLQRERLRTLTAARIAVAGAVLAAALPINPSSNLRSWERLGSARPENQGVLGVKSGHPRSVTDKPKMAPGLPWRAGQVGGGDRNRTGVQGFAGPYPGSTVVHHRRSGPWPDIHGRSRTTADGGLVWGWARRPALATPVGPRPNDSRNVPPWHRPCRASGSR